MPRKNRNPRQSIHAASAATAAPTTSTTSTDIPTIGSSLVGDSITDTTANSPSEDALHPSSPRPHSPASNTSLDSGSTSISSLSSVSFHSLTSGSSGNSSRYRGNSSTGASTGSSAGSSSFSSASSSSASSSSSSSSTSSLLISPNNAATATPGPHTNTNSASTSKSASENVVSYYAESLKSGALSQIYHLAHTVETEIGKGHAHVSTISSLLNKMGNHMETKSVRTNLAESMRETNDIIHTIQSCLTQLSSSKLTKGLTKQQRDERKTVELSLLKEFHRLREEFVTLAKLARQTLQDQSSRQVMELENPAIDDERLALLDEQDVITVEIDPSDLQLAHSQVVDQHTAVMQIYDDMRAVQEMFSDLATIVADHGVLLDDFHKRVSRVNDSTTQAHKDLLVGAKYHMDTRNRMCCMACFLIIATVVGLFVMTRVFRIMLWM